MNEEEPKNSHCEMASDEIDLIDLFLIVWKRKIMIIAVTLLVTLAAVGISLILPKVYAVTAILEPGKDADGKLVENPQAIRENILGGAYDQMIVDHLGIALEKIPDFKVSVPKNTDLVKITIESVEPENAIKVLDNLINFISKKIETQLDIKKAVIENDLQAALYESTLYPEQIKNLEDLILKSKSKINELESGRKNLISKTDADSMAFLLYLNEIQNQQVFLNSLYSNLSELKIKKDQSLIDISNVRLQLVGIKGTNINKAPSMPETPVGPKKTLIVALAFILSLMGGIMLAFFAEFIDKVRHAQKAVE